MSLTPDNPENPGTPETPIDSGAPDNSETPDDSNTPVVADAPSAADAPDAPPAAPEPPAPPVAPTEPPLPERSATHPLATEPAGFEPAAIDSLAEPAITPAPVTAPRAKRAMAPLLGMLAVGALIGGIAGGGVVAAVLAGSTPLSPSTTSAPTSFTVNDSDETTLVTAVVATAGPAVVTLTVAGGGTAGNGSGVILSADGYVLTNNHVATLEGATLQPSIRVTLADGRIFDAELIGSDPIADLAVVKLEGAENLPTIEFADSDALNVGDRTVVIGAPLGLAGSVSNGIVSALNRSITVRSSAVPEQQSGQQAPPEGERNTPFDFWDFNTPGTDEAPSGQPRANSGTVALPVIQTDAAINPGNSGGALLNDEGKLIGIVVAIATAGGSGGQSGSIGVGFSIPSNFAQRIASELIANGTASHGLLGASVTDSLNEAGSTVAGALVDSVLPGGAAEQAGLRSGDVITVFNGVRVSGSVDLTAQVRVLAGGARSDLTYVRGSSTEKVSVTLGELQ